MLTDPNIVAIVSVIYEFQMLLVFIIITLYILILQDEMQNNVSDKTIKMLMLLLNKMKFAHLLIKEIIVQSTSI